MPTKTIYVSNDDLNTFDRAQDLAGENLSAVIARALTEFITRKEAVGKGMKEITVQVGSKGLHSEKRFIGRTIAKWKGPDDAQREWLEAVVYKTKKDQIAVALEHKGPFNWDGDWQKSDYWKLLNASNELLVFAEPGEAKGKLPEALVKVIDQAVQRDEAPVEYLDI